MGCNTNGGAPTQFALVSYIADPLGLFLDRLRLEMVPGCKPHAHVTILPPRPVKGQASVAAEELESRLSGFCAFEIGLADIEVFPASNVIYLGLGRGAAELRQMYETLNRGKVAFEEPFPYHPHITLAQNFDPAQVGPLRDLAARRWAEYRGVRSFHVETLAFVRNERENHWIDLATISLPKAELVS